MPIVCLFTGKNRALCETVRLYTLGSGRSAPVQKRICTEGRTTTEANFFDSSSAGRADRAQAQVARVRAAVCGFVEQHGHAAAPARCHAAAAAAAITEPVVKREQQSRRSRPQWQTMASAASPSDTKQHRASSHWRRRWRLHLVHTRLIQQAVHLEDLVILRAPPQFSVCRGSRRRQSAACRGCEQRKASSA